MHPGDLKLLRVRDRGHSVQFVLQFQHPFGADVPEPYPAAYPVGATPDVRSSDPQRLNHLRPHFRQGFLVCRTKSLERESHDAIRLSALKLLAYNRELVSGVKVISEPDNNFLAGAPLIAKSWLCVKDEVLSTSCRSG